MIRAVQPHPIQSLALFGASVLLSGSAAPPSLALALLMALAAPHIMRALEVGDSADIYLALAAIATEQTLVEEAVGWLARARERRPRDATLDRLEDWATRERNRPRAP